MEIGVENFEASFFYFISLTIWNLIIIWRTVLERALIIGFCFLQGGWSGKKNNSKPKLWIKAEVVQTHVFIFF